MARTDLSTYDNSWYKPGRGIVIRAIWYLVNAIFFINPVLHANGLKKMLLRLFGSKVGKGVVLKPGINIKYPWNLEIGDHAWIGERVWLDSLAKIRVGPHACLSQGAFLLTGNHRFDRSGFDLEIKEINLEAGAWIGAKAIVCPGVNCKDHAVLAVGSVATSDLEPFSVYQGNPAIKVKERTIQ
jgi:putative colanic acid biosynthesis acetyltransferase WcaF